MAAEPDATPPTLIDRFGRRHTSLRVSVTDRCNLRCLYCMPACGVPARSHDDVLRFEQIVHVARVAVEMGVDRIRLTGGEPLVRRGIVELVHMLAELPGLRDLSMTTNGVALADHAQSLRAAGLRRVNVSLDTVRREPYRRLTRRDALPEALNGIDAARHVGLMPVKLNAVLLRGFSEYEIVPLARFSRSEHLPLRLIERMPTAGADSEAAGEVWPADEALEMLRRHVGPLEPCEPAYPEAAAVEYRWADGEPTLGLIRSVTDPFCRRCNRLRLTADGRLMNCLFSDRPTDLGPVLRQPPHKNTPREADIQLAQLLRDAVQSKCRQHGHGQPTDRPMYQIGG